LTTVIISQPQACQHLLSNSSCTYFHRKQSVWMCHFQHRSVPSNWAIRWACMLKSKSFKLTLRKTSDHRDSKSKKSSRCYIRARGVILYIVSLPPSLPPFLFRPPVWSFFSHFPLLRSSCPSTTYGLMIVFLMLLMIHFIFAALNATYLSVSFLTLPVCMRVYTQTLG
jgi:hypothetical protein